MAAEHEHADQETEQRLTGQWDLVTLECDCEGALARGDFVVEYPEPHEPLEGQMRIEWRHSNGVVVAIVQEFEIVWDGESVRLSGRIPPEYEGQWIPDEFTCTIDENRRLVGRGIDARGVRTNLIVLEPVHGS